MLFVPIESQRVVEGQTAQRGRKSGRVQPELDLDMLWQDLVWSVIDRDVRAQFRAVHGSNLEMRCSRLTT